MVVVASEELGRAGEDMQFSSGPTFPSIDPSWFGVDLNQLACDAGHSATRHTCHRTLLGDKAVMGVIMAVRKVFTDSVTELPSSPGVTPHELILNKATKEAHNEKMDLLFSLAIPSRDDLEKKVAAGETVSAADLNKTYAPKASDVEALKKWLGEHGFKVTGQSADGSSIYANATVGEIEQSLGVNMVQVTKDGVTYTAAQDAPSLPADVGGPVHAIIGLQPFLHAYKQRACRSWPTIRATLGHNGQPTPSAANAPPYLVGEILKAYNADGLAHSKWIDHRHPHRQLPRQSDHRRVLEVAASMPIRRGSSRSTSPAATCRRSKARRRLTRRGRARLRPRPRSRSMRPARCSSSRSTGPSTGSSPTLRPIRACDSCRSASGLARPTWAGRTAKRRPSTRNTSSCRRWGSTCSSRAATPGPIPEPMADGQRPASGRIRRIHSTVVGVGERASSSTRPAGPLRRRQRGREAAEAQANSLPARPGRRDTACRPPITGGSRRCRGRLSEYGLVPRAAREADFRSEAPVGPRRCGRRSPR